MVKSVLQRKELYVKKSAIHGYGVFAGTDIHKDEIIEECYTLLVPKKTPDLIDYIFKADDNSSALPLGCGPIYNHASQPNADFIYDPENQVMTFKALESIKSGEEILISYGTDWFVSRTLKCKKPSLRFRLRHANRFLKMLRRFGGALIILYGSIYLIKLFPLLAYLNE